VVVDESTLAQMRSVAVEAVTSHRQTLAMWIAAADEQSVSGWLQQQQHALAADAEPMGQRIAAMHTVLTAFGAELAGTRPGPYGPYSDTWPDTNYAQYYYVFELADFGVFNPNLWSLGGISIIYVLRDNPEIPADRPRLALPGEMRLFVNITRYDDATGNPTEPRRAESPDCPPVPNV
jgi:hypothetical protein